MPLQQSSRMLGTVVHSTCNIGLFASSLEWFPTMSKGVIKNTHNPWLLMEYPRSFKLLCTHMAPGSYYSNHQQVPLVL